MKEGDKELWRGLREDARAELRQRDYATASLAERMAKSGVDAGVLTTSDRGKMQGAWIPGVEIFKRDVFPQRHRGSFGELVRRGEGTVSRIGFWPQQWAAARMFAQSAKGFHVHPPHVPENVAASDWFRRLFVDEPDNFSLRPYEREQWDVMFFVQGLGEMILCETRDGLPARAMRFFVDGDNHRSANNVGIVIPAGVAHAIRAEGSEDVIMIYGTSTTFQPASEGRIASDIETSFLPEEWQRFLTD